jgi:CRISPR-associated protein Cmr4
VVPGSAVKGVLADQYHATDGERTDPLRRAAFGVAGDENSNSGALVFTDARLVCLAVCSLYGTFAWVTSHLALKRLKRDLDAAGLADDLPEPPQALEGKILLPQGCQLNGGTETVYLADLDFNRENLDLTKKGGSEKAEAANKWQKFLKESLFSDKDIWRSEFQARFAIIHSNSFDYLCDTATQVDARIKIDPARKTVDKEHGALWYEESLPAESILAGLVWCDRVYVDDKTVTQEKLISEFCQPVSLQVGGKATIGKGRVRFITSVGEAVQ